MGVVSDTGEMRQEWRILKRPVQCDRKGDFNHAMRMITTHLRRKCFISYKKYWLSGAALKKNTFVMTSSLGSPHMRQDDDELEK